MASFAKGSGPVVASGSLQSFSPPDLDELNEAFGEPAVGSNFHPLKAKKTVKKLQISVFFFFLNVKKSFWVLAQKTWLMMLPNCLVAI